jgi:hypothetical protein
MATVEHNWDKAEVIRVGIRGKKPKITVRRRGWVHLNSAFIRESGIQDKKCVKALIIKEDKKVSIGFLFLDKKEDNTLSLAFGKEKKNAGFSGRNVFSEAGIDTDRKVKLKFDPKTEDYKGEKIYVIELKKD